MTRTVEYTSWPLPELLTRKIVAYLNIYRMVITLLLGFSHFSGLSEAVGGGARTSLASAVLISYMLFAAFRLFSARKPGANWYRVASYSLATDVVFLCLLVFAYAGVNGGIGILLVFTSGAAAVLLPLRMALLLASIASLSMVGTSLMHFALGDQSAESMVRAGLFGVTAMVTAVIANRLAYWARDFRLIAEKRKVTLTELEQVNELIIRRMQTGVIAIDETNLVRVMNESAWFLMGSPSDRHRSLRSLSPRLEQALAEWKRQPDKESRPVILEPSQAQILPSFVALPSDTGLGCMIFLNDNNVVAKRAIELSVNSLAKLSGSIAHDIRNPLAALNHARRMNGIVENILQLSRREQSRPELVPLHTFLPEFANEFETSQVNRAIDFQSAIDAEETYVLYDKSQLSQCLWKLLDNAVDHASRDKSIPKVRLALARDPDAGFCVITVADNGPGISRAQLSKIFEPFYTTRKEGSGLGLYIARQLCEANQAELTVDSEPGEGAYFHIRLALARAAPIQGQEPVPALQR
jgi:two-component system sensor histidine kinase PilS (NtrC family)